MIVATIPSNEQERLAALASYDILDTPTEAAFDEIVRFVASICDAPISLVSLIDADRQWFKSVTGIDCAQTSREVSFCAHALNDPSRLLIVPDASLDPRFADNPLVTDGPKLRFYAGAPLIDSEGFVLGSLCVLDTKPRSITPQQEDALRVGSRAVMLLLEQRRTITRLHLLTEAQRRVEAELRAEIAARQKIEKELRFTSKHDGLTRLPNRTEFIARLEASLARLQGCERRPFAVFFVDLDRFKDVNDKLGHVAGDALLVEVGRRLSDVIRIGDAVARLGGDEFTILVDYAATEADAAPLAERIATVLASKLRVDGAEIFATASIGILLVDETYTSVADILRDADIAMYDAKARGRNRYSVFTPALREAFASASRLEPPLSV